MRTALTLAAVALLALLAGTAKAGDYCQRAVAVTRTVTYVPAPVAVAVAVDHCQTTVVDETPVLLNRVATYGGSYGYSYGYANTARRVNVVRVANQNYGGYGGGFGGGFVGGQRGAGAGGGGSFIANTVDSVNRLVNSPAGNFALGAFVAKGFKFGK